MDNEESTLKWLISNKKLIWNFIILTTIIIIIIFSLLTIIEITSARKNCKEFGGNYKLIPFEHTCNNKTFIKYTDGSWNYEREEINLSKFIN